VEDNSEIGREFLEARQGENFPPEWLEYRQYGRADQQRYVRILAGQAAFGDNMADLLAQFHAAFRSMDFLIDE
jgi:hypothetical protein